MYHAIRLSSSVRLPSFAREIVPCALPWGESSEVVWQALQSCCTLSNLECLEPRAAAPVLSGPRRPDWNARRGTAMADAAAPPAAAAKLQKKNDGVATAAHAFLFALLALASLGLGRLYVLLGAVACTCVTFVVARRAPSTETPTKPSSGSVDDDDDKRPRWERRYMKTEAKKARRREARSAQTKNTRRELSEAEAREKAKRADDLQRKRDQQAREREEALRRKQQQKLQKEEELRRQKEEKRQKDKQREQERRRAKEKKLKEKKEAQLQAKKLAEAQKTIELSEKSNAFDACVAAYVACCVLADEADAAHKTCEEALTSASGKKRSNKAKATAKKAREKAENAAETARQKRADRDAARSNAEDARRTLADYCSQQNLAPPPQIPCASPQLQKRPSLQIGDDVMKLIARVRKHGGCVPDDSDDDDVVSTGARVAPSDVISSDDDMSDDDDAAVEE